MPCPNPRHEGLKAKSAGTRRAAPGLRRDYVCQPTVGKVHTFAVVIEVEDQPVPLYAPPACPVHGKDAVRIRNGTYGKPGESVRRQRYRCYPCTPDPKYPKGRHNVTPPLPREHVHTGESHCGACEEMRGVHHGDQVVARAQSWNLRVVVEGLEKLASGADTYSSVGSWAWAFTGRFTFNRPLSCIDLRFGPSSKVLPDVIGYSRRSETPAIAWLDDDGSISTTVTADAALVAAQAVPLTMLTGHAYVAERGDRIVGLLVREPTRR